MQGNRVSFRAVFVGKSRFEPGSISLVQISCKAFPLCATETLSSVVGRTDFVHEGKLGPEGVLAPRNLFVEVRPELANQLASSDPAASESRGDHTGADQRSLRPARRRRQLPIGQHCERWGEVTEHAMNVGRILRLRTAPPDEIRHFVPNCVGRIRSGLYGFGNLSGRPIKSTNGVLRLAGSLHERNQLIGSDDLREQTGCDTVHDSIGPGRRFSQHRVSEIPHGFVPAAGEEGFNCDNAVVLGRRRVECDATR